jgi:nitroreductase
MSSEPVPFELVENTIRCASLAASGANQQPWKFVLVKDSEIKRKIREAAEVEERESYEQRMPQDGAGITLSAHFLSATLGRKHLLRRCYAARR